MIHISAAEVTIWTGQLVRALRAGLPIIEALHVLSSSRAHRGWRRLCARLITQLQQGQDFSHALEQHPRIFDDFYCAIVRWGEETGQLPLLLEQVIHWRSAQQKFHRQLWRALRYPLCMLALTLVVCLFMMFTVIPAFAQFFADQQAPLPTFTQVVFNITENIRHQGILWGLGVGIFSTIIIALYQISWIRRMLDQGLRLLPFIGQIRRLRDALSCARMLAIALESGIHLVAAMAMISPQFVGAAQHHKIRSCLTALQQGMPLNEALRRYRCFPKHLIYQLAASVERGQMDEALNNIVITLEETLDTRLTRMLSLVQPFFILLIGVLVGGLIIAVYLPLLTLGQAMQ